MVFENLLALLIAVEFEKSQEQSFKILDKIINGDYENKVINKDTRVVISYTFEDYEDIQNLMKQGISVAEICSYYGYSRFGLKSFIEKMKKQNR